jgi:hypothetical protein
MLLSAVLLCAVPTSSTFVLLPSLAVAAGTSPALRGLPPGRRATNNSSNHGTTLHAFVGRYSVGTVPPTPPPAPNVTCTTAHNPSDAWKLCSDEMKAGFFLGIALFGYMCYAIWRMYTRGYVVGSAHRQPGGASTGLKRPLIGSAEGGGGGENAPDEPPPSGCTRLLAVALAVVLVPLVVALGCVWRLVTNAAERARRGEGVNMMQGLAMDAVITGLVLAVVYVTIASAPTPADPSGGPFMFYVGFLWLPGGLFGVLWPTLLGESSLPFLRTFLFALPVWRSPTEKLRAFAGAGDANRTRRLLGTIHGEAGSEAVSVRFSVDVIRGGAFGDDGKHAVVTRLLAAGASPDAVDTQGRSALHLMCWHRNIRIMGVLLEGGADPNLRDMRGETPLHKAVKPSGADLYLRDSSDEERVGEAIALLLAHGADPNVLSEPVPSAWRSFAVRVMGHDKLFGPNAHAAGAAARVEIIERYREGQAKSGLIRHASGLSPPATPLMKAVPAHGRDEMPVYQYNGREVLLPSPTWGAVKQALGAAADGAGAVRAVLALLPEGGGLRPLQLFDMLWCKKLETDAVARVARRRLVFEQLIAPLVREAPVRKLEPEEKALLVRACQATAGVQQGEGGASAGSTHMGFACYASGACPIVGKRFTKRDVRFGLHDASGSFHLCETEFNKLDAGEQELFECVSAAGREGHREPFDELLRATMEQFAAQLRAEYDAVAAMPGGAALLALPATELLHGTAKEALRQDAEAIGGPAPWLAEGADGDLASAYRCALAPSGVVGSPEALCKLLQCGQHPLLKEARPAHFDSTVKPKAFWQHMCALQSVVRHEPLNAEFHAHIKDKLDGVHGACFKDAPLKGYDRIAVKAAQYHAELGLPNTPVAAGTAAARVIDIVRCSFEVPSAEAALALCAWLDAATLLEHGVRALRRKNGFHTDAPSAGGYRDVKYNLLFQSAKVGGAMGRAIVEVQIILQAYLKVKKKMHAVYRIDRGDFG